MTVRGILVIAASAIFALAVFPFYVAYRDGHDRDTLATAIVSAPPSLDDDAASGARERDGEIAFWERAVRERHRNDMLSPRTLAGLYLQRYRETGDIDDVTRARSMALRSLSIEPRSIATLATLTSIDLTLHRFASALRENAAVLAFDPDEAGFLAQRASLLMEVGDYAGARAALDRIAPRDRGDPTAESVLARYDELTGKLTAARGHLADATRFADFDETTLAQSRAWYHLRSGELAFEAGDVETAIAQERRALAIFPTYNLALKDLAKYELCVHRYALARDAATRGAAVTPFPETLGYEADAEAALGDAHASAVTRDTIFAIERVGNAYGVNDRLLAVYYSDHGLRPADALAIARREVRVRGDEIYAQDTLAWAAAMDGRWDEARAAMRRALRYGTADSLLQFHAGTIALHFGDAGAARRYFAAALARNPDFHPRFAEVARTELRRLDGVAATRRARAVHTAA